MFTIAQIKTAHSKVKSGADFPGYIRELKSLGVQSYDHFVSDGHIRYHGSHAFSLAGPSKWAARDIASPANADMLKQCLKIHQQGGTDYITFCAEAAASGVEKWTVDIIHMTCTYYDTAGNHMLEEIIPEV